MPAASQAVEHWISDSVRPSHLAVDEDGARQLCADTALACHDQVVADLSKIADRLDAVMDLMGPVIGVIALAVGIQTYRDGGSVGWPLVGAALLVINLLDAWRRLSGRRRPDASP